MFTKKVASTGASAAEWEAASAREIASKLSALIAPVSVSNVTPIKARA